MLFPVAASEDGSAAAFPQDIFVNSGCICAVLEAIKAADSPNPDGPLSWMLYSLLDSSTPIQEHHLRVTSTGEYCEL